VQTQSSTSTDIDEINSIRTENIDLDEIFDDDNENEIQQSGQRLVNINFANLIRNGSIDVDAIQQVNIISSPILNDKNND
jgi:hypothetical protein